MPQMEFIIKSYHENTKRVFLWSTNFLQLFDWCPTKSFDQCFKKILLINTRQNLLIDALKNLLLIGAKQNILIIALKTLLLIGAQQKFLINTPPKKKSFDWGFKKKSFARWHAQKISYQLRKSEIKFLINAFLQLFLHFDDANWL